MCQKPKGIHNRIDKCMKNAIFILKNRLGVPTCASCCGHKRYPMTIVIRDELGVYELFSGAEIPRKRNFYYKDSKNHYYIPEVSKPKS